MANMPEKEFSVHDEQTLSWYVDKINAIEEKKRRIAAQCEAMTADLERERENIAFLFEAQANAVAKQLIEAQHGKTKHLKLLTGTVGFRSTPERFKIADTELALTWFKTHAPECVIEKVETKLIAKRLQLTEDGRVIDRETAELLDVPGLVGQPKEEKFYISAKESKEEA